MIGGRIFRLGLERGHRWLQNRSLLTDESIGLTSFDAFRRRRQESATISKDELWRRLDQSTITQSSDGNRSSSSHSKLIFSEDLLQTVAAIESREEADRFYRSIKPFVEQRVDGGRYRALKKTTRPIAPLLMKLFHRLRHPQLAYRALVSDEDKALEEFYGSSLQCYQIAMDLFYETRRYQYVLDAWDKYEQRRRSSSKEFANLPAFPRSLQVLVLAACYKMDTSESLEYAMKFVESGYENDSESVAFTRKSLALIAGLAANRHETELAYEFLSLMGHDVADAYTAPRTLKCILLVRLGRWPEVFELFKRVLESDIPAQSYQDRELSVDAIRAVEAVLGSIDDKETVERLKRACLLLRRGGHVIEASLEALLCAPVQIVPSALMGCPISNPRPEHFKSIGGVAAIGPQQSLAAGGSTMNRSVAINEAQEAEDERNLWQTSSVYEDDSSAMASMEKFRESERKLRRVERKKRKILSTVGKWIREEGPLEVDDDRSGR